MKRLTEAWMEWKGVRSEEKGLLLTAMPARPHPAEGGRYETVPGRSGRLWIPDGSYNPIQVRVQWIAARDFDVDELGAWLSGSGLLCFSDEPDRAYRARITGEFTRKPKFSRLDAQEFSVVFDCDPFRYEYPEPRAKTLTNGGSIHNAGAASEPRILVTGAGDGVLTVGAQMIEIEGMDGGVILDSELKDAFSPDGLTLCSDKIIADDFPTLAPGKTFIAWSGGITGVQILPRWRFL